MRIQNTMLAFPSIHLAILDVAEIGAAQRSIILIIGAIFVAILIEAGLSYLGLGVQPPAATWGNMLKQAQAFPRQAPWYVIAPGAFIFVVALALNFLGDALRDRLDPQLRKL
jgi:peptide/nickel transport system permease protein